MDYVVIIGAIAILIAAFLYFRHLIRKSDAESADIIANGSIHDTPKLDDFVTPATDTDAIVKLETLQKISDEKA